MKSRSIWMSEQAHVTADLKLQRRKEEIKEEISLWEREKIKQILLAVISQEEFWPGLDFRE